MSAWKSVSDKHVFAIAKANYHQNKENRLELDVGDSVVIISETTNWYYGYNKINRNIRGIFPKSYVHIVECVISKNDYVIKRSEIVEEITTILKEWQYLFRQFYLTNHSSFKAIRQKMLELIRLRSQILSGNLPVDEMKDIKLKATSEIDTGNKLLALDMVVRDDCGNILDINTTSTTQLYEHHVHAVDRIKRASTSLSKNRIIETMNRHSHNLLVSVHNFVCKVSEDTELLFTLYDGEEMKAITENYVVKWSRQGVAWDLDQFNNLRVLFTDLSGHDLGRNKIYLIAYVVRVGAMDGKDADTRRSSMANVIVTSATSKKQSQLNSQMSTPNTPTPTEQMRRPFGVAALDLIPIIKKSDDFKSDTQLPMPFIPCEKECLDSTLRKMILNKDISKGGSSIWISVELLHGDIKQVKEEYPHLVLGNVAFSRKMGFPEVIFPGDVRNDLYLTLVNGEFSKGSKSSDKNIEVTVVVCNETGATVPGVITQGGGASMLNEYKSVIYYHDDKPKWNETFKINVPIEEFKQCHLRYTFKHRSSNEAKDRTEKPFGLSYVKLMNDNGTTLQHKRHQLLVYKIDHKKFDSETQYNYLKLPSLADELGNNTKPSTIGFSIASKDSFTIETNLCSTKLTQNVDILGLLNWSTHIETMEDSLNALMNVKGEEVVKFLQDILDALFNILVSNEDSVKFDNLVFKCLLRLIEIVYDLKYQHFQSVLDLYINESFSATLAYEKLINVVQTHIKNAINNVSADSEPNTYAINDNDEMLYRTTKYLQYIMKFIIRSRILFANMNDNKDRLLFETSLEDLLESFTELISYPNGLLKSQGAMLKYLHIIASDLMQVYEPVKLSRKIVDIITHIPTGRLNQSKMACIKDVVDSKLFKLPQCRAILLPVFCRQIKDKLESREEGDFMFDIRQQEKNLTKAAKVLGESKSHLHTRETTAKTKVAECVNIMNNMLELLFHKDVGSTENDVRDIMLCLLRTVIQSSIAMDRDNPLVGNLVAIMLGIFRSMTATHYKQYVNHFNTRYDLQDFLTEILLVFKDLVSKPVFNNDWMDMIMHQNTVILESLRHFSGIIMDHFFNPFEKQVWSNFFHCSIAFLIQPALQLDQFRMNKQSIIVTRYRDIRRETAFEIRKMWFNLGEQKTIFVPQLVGPILEMSMIPEIELRKATIPIFFDMMQCEYYSSRFINESFGDTKRNTAHIKGNFNDFEKEIIEKLDYLIEGGRGDTEYKELFFEIMYESCSNHNTLKVDGVQCVNILTRLMERLLEYRCIIHDESKENRMACTVSLLQFYSEVNRKEMYIRYVNKLCDLHMEFDNYTEAAYTLRLHSNELNWSETSLSPLLRSNRHQGCINHRSLKEELYKDIIDYFDKGKMWECAIDMCKELAQQYENEIFDYLSLSDLYQLMSRFYKKILENIRHESNYYRVAFYGFGFPDFLRNKMFVYRGNEYEDSGSFNMRILSQHPRAELLQTLNPGSDVTHGEGQYVQIVKVDPIIDDYKFSTKERKNIASKIIKFYQTNNVQQFQFSRPVRDKESGGDPNDVGNTWFERTLIKTTNPLPGILRWFPVECYETIKISPLEMAIETVESKNKGIRELIFEHKNDPNLAIHSLSAVINGVVDAAVNGGIPIYEDAFLTPEYLEKRPNDDHLVAKLKDLIASQIPLLEIAISVHLSKTPPSLMPLHERLESCFADIQTSVEAKYGKRTTDIKFDRESCVTLRRQMSIHPQVSMDSNRLSETSMGSSDSGFSKSQSSRPTTTSSSIKSTFANFNFNTSNLTRTSLGTSPGSKGKKEKTPNKRRSSRKIDREALSLPVANSQWYTANTASLSTINDSTLDKDGTQNTPSSAPISYSSGPASMPVFELTEELHPKRPLRSEVEKEKRLSRPTSVVTPTLSIKTLTGDNNSLSGESSNRNSIITTDSTTSEEDLIPPPLPIKTRDSDYSNLPPADSASHRRNFNNNYVTCKPLPPIPFVVNTSYDFVEIRNNNVVYDERKRPPTPPPKPARNSKIL